jgi:hypothetical protein
LNWSGMDPVLPGSTFLSQVPAVVQPQPGRTSRMRIFWGRLFRRLLG